MCQMTCFNLTLEILFTDREKNEGLVPIHMLSFNLTLEILFTDRQESTLHILLFQNVSISHLRFFSLIVTYE